MDTGHGITTGTIAFIRTVAIGSITAGGILIMALTTPVILIIINIEQLIPIFVIPAIEAEIERVP